MTMKVRALLSLVATVIAMSLSSCGHYTCGTTFGSGTCTSSGGGITTGGGGGTGSGLVAFDYTVDFSLGGQVSRGMGLQKLDVGANTYSALTAFVPPLVPPYPTGIVIATQGHMYVPSADGTLFSFLIDGTTGNLSNIGTNPIAVTGGNSVAASASGNLIFVGDTAGQRISVYTVNTDGSLTVVAGSPFATSGVSPAVMATDGQSKFLYATSGPGSGQIAAFSIGSSGALTAVAGSPFSSTVSAIAGDPSGKFLLGVSWQNGDNSVHVFSINSSTGALTGLGSTFTTGTPRNLAIHPNGNWVYTFSEDPSLGQQEAVEGFVLDDTSGTLTQMTGSPFSNIIANGGAIEQSGKFLFALGVTVFSSGPAGTVTPYSIDTTSGALAIWPSGGNSALGFPGLDEASFAVSDAP